VNLPTRIWGDYQIPLNIVTGFQEFVDLDLDLDLDMDRFPSCVEVHIQTQVRVHVSTGLSRSDLQNVLFARHECIEDGRQKYGEQQA
jgi:hypothetical protein